MLDIKPADYKYCPFCGHLLGERWRGEAWRKYCVHCDWTYYPRVASAAAAVIIKNGHVLMVKRAKDPFKGSWTFPSGFVDFGENPADTVIREAKEETGYTVTDPEFLCFAESEDDPRSPGHWIFFYKVTPGELGTITDPEENDDMGWFDTDELPDMDWAGHEVVAEKLKEIK